jgi:hypothetical protein
MGAKNRPSRQDRLSQQDCLKGELMTFVLEAFKCRNFQSLRDPVEIPIKPLTLLFGPNSAGKSAIYDGLQLAADIWGLECFESFDGLKDRLDRWHYQGPRKGDDTAPLMIEVSGRIYDPVSTWNLPNGHSISLIWDHLGQRYPEIAREWPGSISESHMLTTRAEFTSSDWGRWEIRVEYEFNGERILFFTDSTLEINCRHPFLEEMCRHRLGEWFEHLESEKNVAAIKNGIFTYEGGGNLGRQVNWYEFVEIAEWEYGVFELFKAITDFFTDCVSHEVSGCIRPSYVPGNRVPAGHDELLFTVANSYMTEKEGVESTTARVFPYYRLASAGLSNLLLTTVNDIEPEGDDAEDDIVTNLWKECHRYNAIKWINVNHALSANLFVERGYQLKVNVQLILPSRLGPETVGMTISTKDIVYGSSRISLGLIDGMGRQVRLDDVGAGIGYVLPVLEVACDVRRVLSFIEQPELHLHPSLQAGLGDALLERANAGHKLIIETHSEHLTLRLLRRVRASGLGKPTPPELHLDPDQIAILYFDPRADGATHVKHIRISKEGEFLNPWPRGFFTEREKDIFDE